MDLKRFFPSRKGMCDLLINMKHPAGFRCWFPLDEAGDVTRKMVLLKRYTERIDASARLMEKLNDSLWKAINTVRDFRYPARRSQNEIAQTWEEMISDLYRMTCEAMAYYTEIQGFRSPDDFDASRVPVGTAPQPTDQDDPEQQG